jgi:two-component system, cell cycle response regulator DivK
VAPLRLRPAGGYTKCHTGQLLFNAGSIENRIKEAVLVQAVPQKTTFEGGPIHGGDMTKTVLIVEDNELNMKLFNDLLVAFGYKTVKTREGLKALDLAREHRPDLIIMDIQLPEVSGLDIVRWIKAEEELNPIPIIAVTAFAMRGDEERIRDSGCQSYLSKPISVGTFMSTVKKFIG